jgi:hypothetical protein
MTAIVKPTSDSTASAASPADWPPSSQASSKRRRDSANTGMVETVSKASASLRPPFPTRCSALAAGFGAFDLRLAFAAEERRGLTAERPRFPLRDLVATWVMASLPA